MTIKKQFSILATVIIAIPILCIIYMSIHNYIRSIDRILVKDFMEFKKNEGSLYTKDELRTIRESLRFLPAEVDAAIISSNNQVLLSSIPELPAKKEIDFQFLWNLQNMPSKKYYYQMSVIDSESIQFLLITRVFKDKTRQRPPIGMVASLMIFLFVIALFCFILILLIFKSISKSIITLEHETQDIANGDLSVQIQTEEKSRSNEITSICESLEKMRLSLVEAQNQQTKFIMGISHDLRTPVAVIKGYMEALSDGIISEKDELTNAYSLISCKINQLDDMINSLINFMKMNYKEFRDQLSTASITSLIKDFANDAKSSGNVFERQVITNINLSEDYIIPLNKSLISRAFENLLSNALRYTEKNDTITISADKIDNSIIFKIADTGIGIDKEDLSQIFNLFYRGTNSRREEGMGIGLSVVKNVMDTHNWKIDVESEKGKGSCFIITIPLSPDL